MQILSQNLSETELVDLSGLFFFFFSFRQYAKHHWTWEKRTGKDEEQFSAVLKEGS